MKESLTTLPAERIEQAIYLIRGQRVMLDFDLAALYQVTTKALNQAVRRNRERFPEDFMFQPSPEESKELNRSQIVTGSQQLPHSQHLAPLRSKIVTLKRRSQTR